MWWHMPVFLDVGRYRQRISSSRPGFCMTSVRPAWLHETN